MKYFTYFLLLIFTQASTQKETFSEEEINEIQKLKSDLDEGFTKIEIEVRSLANALVKVYENKKLHLEKGDTEKFVTAKNGTYHKLTKPNEPDVWISANYAKNSEARSVALFTRGINPLLKQITQKNTNIVQAYYNSKQSINRIFPPIDAVIQYEAGLEIPNFNFYYLADLKHNPNKLDVWVDEPYVDPAGRGWMVSAISPVYKNNILEGVAGVDVTLNSLETKLSRKDKFHFLLIHKKGLVISTTERLASLLELPELKNHQYIETIKSNSFQPDQFNLLKSKSESIRILAQKILQSNEYKSNENLGKKVSIYSIALNKLPWVLIAFKETD